MKNLLTFLFVSISVCLIAQAPNAFKYQAVARDGSGELIINTTVSFQISLLQASPTGTVVYSETHNLLTNDFGLVNIEIGNGTVVTGDFSTIDWSLGDYFLQIEMDETGGSNYLLMGTSQLLSVPYAKYAENAGASDDGDWSVSGNNIYSEPGRNIGIGTTNPTSILDIENSGSYIYENTSQKLSVYSDGTNAYTRIKFHRSHSPVLGDDTSSSSVTLDGDKLGLIVFGGNRINGSGASSSSAGWMEMIQKGTATGSGLPGQFQFITSNGLGDRDTRMVIDPFGKVGIGTETPTDKLDLEGDLNMNGNQIKNMVIENRTSDPSNPAVGRIWIRTDL